MKFDLILVGNLLFAYADGNHLGNSAEEVFNFHYDSIVRLADMLRSDSSEIRIFPIGTASSDEYAGLKHLIGKLEMNGLRCKRVPSNYHFVRRWTEMLKISRS